MRPTRTPSALAIAALAVLACGCGGSVTSARPTRADDLATARTGALRLGDLPRGWAARRRPESAPLPCPALLRAQAEATARTATATYNAPSGSPQVGETVALYADRAVARRTVAALASGATRACLARETSAVHADGSRYTGSKATRLLVGAAADEVAGTRIDTTYRTDDEAVPIHVDVVTLRRGRGVARVTLSATREPASFGVRTATLRAAARRLTSALPGEDG